MMYRNPDDVQAIESMRSNEYDNNIDYQVRDDFCVPLVQTCAV